MAEIETVMPSLVDHTMAAFREEPQCKHFELLTVSEEAAPATERIAGNTPAASRTGGKLHK